MPQDIAQAIDMIDCWFKAHCNGVWEHTYGIDLTTTDNPGWWLTVKQFEISKEVLASLLGNLLLQHDAQVSTDGSSLRVFAPTLQHCLLATAAIIDAARK